MIAMAANMTTMTTNVWAHRGASAYAPENTMEAFQLAIEQGADGIELDVQLTKDNMVVVIHDETIDRVSTGSGWVQDYTLEELRQFRFNQTHPEFPEAVIPTLEEVLELLKPTDLMVNIELKTSIIQYEGIEASVLNMVKDMEMGHQVIYSSFYHPSLVLIKELDSTAQTGLLYSDGWIDVPAYGKDIQVDALHPALYHVQSEELIKEARDLGLALHVWTVDDEEHMKYLVEHKVNAIITNKPDVCRRMVDQAMK